jgi:hypothetical protein
LTLRRALDEIAGFMQLHNARKSRWAIRTAIVTPKRPFFCRTTILIFDARECESVTWTMCSVSAPSSSPNRPKASDQPRIAARWLSARTVTDMREDSALEPHLPEQTDPSKY